MNKQELKKMLKPLIKECIKEVVFEEGTLSTIIKEVVASTSSTPMVETKVKEKQKINTSEDAAKKLYERKKKLLDDIGKDSFNGVNIFEGTTPAPAPQQSGQGALSDVDPNDSGVDISAMVGKTSAIWEKMSGNKK